MILRAPHDAALALLVWLISGTVALAQQSSVEVRSPSAKLLETAPGRIVTASVVVANRGAVGDEFAERLTLPPGCQRVAPPDVPFRLEAAAQIVRVLAVFVPANMAAGRFDVHYQAQSRLDPSSSASVDLAIQVTPVDGIELSVEPRSEMVLAGDAYTVKVHVANHGNSRVSIQLKQRSSFGFALSTDITAFPLEAGATREIACRVQTDKAFGRHTSHAVTFDVTAVSVAGKTLIASQASVVEIVPLVSGTVDPFHQLPMQLRYIGIAGTGHPVQLQTELSGAGSLDEAGKHRVDFLFRGPDVHDASMFGDRDEYGASYHGENWDVALGDRIFVLSPLTEKQSLGRGAGVTWHDETTAAGGFYMSTRYRQKNSNELGAFVRRDITQGFSLQGNFLRKTGGDLLYADVLPQNIFSLESHYQLGKLLNVRLEAAFSRSDAGLTDYAYRAEAHGELPGKVNYSIEHIHAGPAFVGYASNTDTTYSSVTKAITPKLQVHASLNRYAGNLALNDVRSTVVNRENSWNAGGNYSITKETDLSLEWYHVEREDILKPAAYDFAEDSARIGVGRNFGSLQLRAHLDLGMLENSITGENGDFQRYGVTASWRPTPRQTYSVFASYGPSAFTASTDEALSAGVSTSLQLKNNLTANLSYARNQYDGLIGREQDQVLTSFRYQFENKSSISLTGRLSRAITRRTTTDSTNEAAIMVAYSIPLSLPISRKRSIGALQGRLFDSTKGRQAGLPRVVLQVGEQFAVTDKEGFFEFPSLKPGKCELRVMPDSLGIRMTMASTMPMKLRILPAETTHVQLEATPACSVSVRVTRFDFAGGNSPTASGELHEVGGQSGVTVEITNGRETWRAQTDRTGSASFDRLLGGRWNLRVASADLPALHLIENPERSLILKPGKDEQVLLRVLPQRRTIRLLDRGTLR